jgi:hypothetical protein
MAVPLNDDNQKSNTNNSNNDNDNNIKHMLAAVEGGHIRP